MSEVSGPVVGIALVLSSVFIPIGLMSGIQGRLNKQFAVTIAISVLISAFNALTLSPALAALLLRPARGIDGGSGALLREASTAGFARATHRYVDVVATADPQGRGGPRAPGRVRVLAGGLGSKLPAGSSPTRTRATCS
jgi:HAE1 family hydrophobic/amphiphilic exporter-1